MDYTEVSKRVIEYYTRVDALEKSEEYDEALKLTQEFYTYLTGVSDVEPDRINQDFFLATRNTVAVYRRILSIHKELKEKEKENNTRFNGLMDDVNKLKKRLDTMEDLR